MTMAAQPTDDLAAQPSDDDMYSSNTGDRAAVIVPSENFNSVNINEFELAAVEMDENNLLLAESGDDYPFNDQFEPEDLTVEGFGLFFDPVGRKAFTWRKSLS
jgi:hypothetical protein